ncbi:MAG: hypothetical protein ABI670_18550 [Chloroflexota bacterium]
MSIAHRSRSGPVYIETENGTVSIVFEATVREQPGGNITVGKPDVYVIDADGVRKRSSNDKRNLAIAVIAVVLAYALGRLSAKRD